MRSGRDQFLKFRPLIRGLRRLLLHCPLGIVVLLKFAMGNVPGFTGSLIRYLYWSRRLQVLGDAGSFAQNLVIKSPDRLCIGDRFSIHDFCYVDAFGGVRIGDDVAIAHGCSILSTNHTWGCSSVPIKYNAVKADRVEIADDVWIGCGVRILAGAKIHKRVVVAAGAVVRGELESGFLYGGVPARKIKPL